MRTGIIILAGGVLWAGCLGLARWLTGWTAASTTLATVAFIALWFIAATVTLWVGVTQAGYAFREELPIFLLIFSVPSIVAAVVKWRFL